MKSAGDGYVTFWVLHVFPRDERSDGRARGCQGCKKAIANAGSRSFIRQSLYLRAKGRNELQNLLVFSVGFLMSLAFRRTVRPLAAESFVRNASLQPIGVAYVVLQLSFSTVAV